MKRTKRYSQTFLAGLLGLAVLVGLNVLAVKESWRWDATEGKQHSLAQESIKILHSLPQPVQAEAFYVPGEPGRREVEEMLKLFASENEKFTFEFVDPDRSPLRAKQAGILQTGTVVFLSGDKRETVAMPDEQKLLNALVRVSNPKRAKIGLVAGHGELNPSGQGTSGCKFIQTTLEEQGADVEPVTLAQLETLPKDLDVLMILGPRADFLPHELELLTQFKNAGGRLFVALSAENTTNLDGWLEKELEIKRLPGLIVDPVGRLFSQDALTPIVQSYGQSPITKDFNMITLYPTCSPLASTLPPTPQGATPPPDGPAYLGLSTQQAWAETDMDAMTGGSAEFDKQTDTPGPLWIAAQYIGTPAAGASENDATQQDKKDETGSVARAVVFGDQDFVSDKYIKLGGNRDFARNSVNWLLERESQIRVSKPDVANVYLMLSPQQQVLVSWVPLIVIPGLCLMLGIIVVLRRRRAK